MRAGWAARRAAASVAGGDGGAWLDGDAARAAACDAAAAPVVTGEINYAALDGLVRLCVELAHLRGTDSDSGRSHSGRDGRCTADASGSAADGDPGAGRHDEPDGPDTACAREALEQAIIGHAVGLLSGPGGLASFLRRRQLGARLGGPSLPLDVGYAETAPPGIRNAVILRDQHRRWPGGYFP